MRTNHPPNSYLWGHITGANIAMMRTFSAVRHKGRAERMQRDWHADADIHADDAVAQTQISPALADLQHRTSRFGK
jgi:hypothetical protein